MHSSADAFISGFRLDKSEFIAKLTDIRNGQKKPSLFDQRTEEASATQYFQFYSLLSQQQNMMQDYVRTSTYQKAIFDNAVDFEGKVRASCCWGSRCEAKFF